MSAFAQEHVVRGVGRVALKRDEIRFDNLSF
jgi:hypothetical protein